MTIDLYEGDPSPERNLYDFMDQVDIVRKDFFGATKHFVSIPTQANFTKFVNHVAQLSEAFMAASGYVIEAEDLEPEEKCTILASLFKEDDSSRVSFFSSIIKGGTDTFKENRASAKELKEAFTLNFETTDTFLFKSHLAEEFKDNFEVDINKLVEAVRTTPNARIMEIGKQVGKHALDVAKIASAVAIGLRLSNVRKKNS